MWRYELSGGMWARKFRRDAKLTLRELERVVTEKGLKLDTPRRDGRTRGSRKLVAVEPKRNRIVAQFQRDMASWEDKDENKSQGNRSVYHAAVVLGRSS